VEEYPAYDYDCVCGAILGLVTRWIGLWITRYYPSYPESNERLVKMQIAGQQI
jgi:hypothetical protein